jgi:hypothetical protein
LFEAFICRGDTAFQCETFPPAAIPRGFGEIADTTISLRHRTHRALVPTISQAGSPDTIPRRHFGQIYPATAGAKSYSGPTEDHQVCLLTDRHFREVGRRGDARIEFNPHQLLPFGGRECLLKFLG